MHKIIADLHTHTVASTHAFNTVTELVEQAKKLGFAALAVTDHGPDMPDAPHLWHFYNIRRLPRVIDGVLLLNGAEANVMDTEGRLDFSNETLDDLRMDWIVASIHSQPLGRKSLSFEETTRVWMNIAANPYVDMIGHAEQRNYPFDYERVTKEFAREGKVVELNAASAVVRPGGEENMRNLLRACKRNGVMVAVNSDAHSIYNLGQVGHVLRLVEEEAYPQELIVNLNRQNLVRAFKARGKAAAGELEEMG